MAMTDEECFDELCSTGIPRDMWEKFSADVRGEIKAVYQRTVRQFTPEEEEAFNQIRNRPSRSEWVGVPGTGGDSAYASEDITPIVDSSSSPSTKAEHYKAKKEGDVECIDAIRSALTEEEFRGYCKGNTIKYVWRERGKGGDESLMKGADYISQAVSGKWPN